MSSWTTRAVSAADAVSQVESGMRVFIHGAAATPTPLIEALAQRRDVADVSLYHLHTTGPAIVEPRSRRSFATIVPTGDRSEPNPPARAQASAALPAPTFVRHACP